MEKAVDVVVVGAGPAGLFTIFQCGMLGLKVAVVDALDGPGGQCAALYPEKPIYDIPGFPSVEGGQLVARLQSQAEPFHPIPFYSQMVETIEDAAGGGFIVSTSAGERILGAAVIVAAGGGSFGPNRPPLAGIEALEGKSVRYCVTRREDFRDARVVIAGGGDSAVDWALSLSDIAQSVQLVHRRPKFRAAPESVRQLAEKVAKGKIELVTPYQLAGIEAQGETLKSVIVATLDGTKQRLEADFLLPFFGLSMDPGPVSRWGLEMEGGCLKVASGTLETSRPGVFAVGDIATYPGKLKLILCGFAEAAMAAHAAHRVARPGEALHFEHSTSRGVPTAA